MSDVQADEQSIRRIDPVSMARSERQLRIEISLSQLARLEGLILPPADEEKVSAVFAFAVNAEGLSCVDGEIRAQVRLTCQRCLSPLSLPLLSDVRWALVDKEDDLPAGYEQLQTEDGRCDLRALIEDELLLALPIVAMHDINDCAVAEQYRQEILVEEARAADEPTQRPFADLAALMAEKDKATR